MRSPTFYAGLSVATSIVTIVLKFLAYYLTGSVGLLSDAVEAVVNIVAAMVALAVLAYSAAAPDREHNFGHEKAQYFSSGIEGALIFVAAGAIKKGFRIETTRQEFMKATDLPAARTITGRKRQGCIAE